jgi:hypothetical protein
VGALKVKCYILTLFRFFQIRPLIASFAPSPGHAQAHAPRRATHESFARLFLRGEPFLENRLLEVLEGLAAHAVYAPLNISPSVLDGAEIRAIWWPVSHHLNCVFTPRV